MTTGTTLDRGRDFFRRNNWTGVYAELSAADRETSLEPEDLERLATAAYLLGKDADSTDLWSRAHQEFRRTCGFGDAGDGTRLGNQYEARRERSRRDRPRDRPFCSAK